MILERMRSNLDLNSNFERIEQKSLEFEERIKKYLGWIRFLLINQGINKYNIEILLS